MNVKLDNKPLVLDLVEWVAAKPRAYADVMDAWRTSCPRLSIWEDTVDLGLVVCRREVAFGLVVEITPAGQTFLASERPQHTAPAGGRR